MVECTPASDILKSLHMVQDLVAFKAMPDYNIPLEKLREAGFSRILSGTRILPISCSSPAISICQQTSVSKPASPPDGRKNVTHLLGVTGCEVAFRVHNFSCQYGNMAQSTCADELVMVRQLPLRHILIKVLRLHPQPKSFQAWRRTRNFHQLTAEPDILVMCQPITD